MVLGLAVLAPPYAASAAAGPTPAATKQVSATPTPPATATRVPPSPTKMPAATNTPAATKTPPPTASAATSTPTGAATETAVAAPFAVQEPSAIVDAHARVSLEEIPPALVRKIAWAGDGKRGSVRIELGAGDLAGSTLLVHADHVKVRVELDVPPGVDAHSWRERIHSKLSARGLDVESVEVR